MLEQFTRGHKCVVAKIKLKMNKTKGDFYGFSFFVFFQVVLLNMCVGPGARGWKDKIKDEGENGILEVLEEAREGGA